MFRLKNDKIKTLLSLSKITQIICFQNDGLIILFSYV